MHSSLGESGSKARQPWGVRGGSAVSPLHDETAPWTNCSALRKIGWSKWKKAATIAVL